MFLDNLRITMNEINHSNHPLTPSGISGNLEESADALILPKSAKVTFAGSTLQVCHHHIRSDAPVPTGLLVWLATMFTLPNWRDMIPLMEGQQLDFKTVKRYCISELRRDPYVLAGLIAGTYGVIPHNLAGRLAFSRHAAGRLLAAEHISQIELCTNWSELQAVFDVDSDFHWQHKCRLRDTMYRECIDRVLDENPDVNPALNIDFFRRLVAAEFALPDYGEIDPLIREIVCARQIQN